MAYDPTDKRLYVASRRGYLDIYNLITYKKEKSANPGCNGARINDIALADGTVIIASDTGSIKEFPTLKPKKSNAHGFLKVRRM